MNKVYRTIWNEATQSWVAVSELAKSHKKSSSGIIGAVVNIIKGVRFTFSLIASALLIMTGQVSAVTGLDYPGTDNQTTTDNLCFFDVTSQSVVCGSANTKTEDTAGGKPAKSVVIGLDSTNTGESNVTIGAGAQTVSGHSLKVTTVTDTATGAVKSTKTEYAPLNTPESSTSTVDPAAGTTTTVVVAKNITSAAIAIGQSAKSTGGYGAAIGYEAEAARAWDISIGRFAGAGQTTTQTEGRNIAIGDGALRQAVNPNNNIALGTDAGRSMTGTANVVLGTYANSPSAGSGNITANDTVAIGNRAVTTTSSSIAIGSRVKASGNISVAIGTSALASGHYAIAQGYATQASGVSSIAIGGAQNVPNQTRATGNYSTALGFAANAGAEGAIAIGRHANHDPLAQNATNPNNTTSADKARTTGVNSVAIGTDTNSAVHHSIAIGTNAKTVIPAGANAADIAGAIAIGRNSNAEGQGSTAMGINARSSGQSIAIGTNANNTFGVAQPIGASTVAIGNNANAQSARSIAFGNDARAGLASAGTGVTAALAIGSASVAEGQGSVVIGDSATNTRTTGNASHPAADQVVAIGVSSNVNSLGGMALGSTAKTTGVYGTSIGIGTVNETDFGVALGALSSTDKNITVNRTGYLGDSYNDVALTVANAAGVSVGGEILNKQGSGPGYTAVRPTGVSDGQVIRRQIHNVAAGTDNTDAVNVSQLKALSSALDASKTHFYSVKSADTGAGNFNNDGAKSANALAAGVNASATGTSAVAIGDNANANATMGSIAIGSSYSGVDRSTGQTVTNEEVKAWSDNAIAIGVGAEAGLDKTDPTKVNAGKTGAIAIGTRALAYEISSVALGEQSNAFGTNSLALGANSTTNNNSGVAIGDKATSEGVNTVALGANTKADGTSAVAIGDQAKTEAAAYASLALGNKALVTAAQGVASGFNAQATVADSVALGSNSKADRSALTVTAKTGAVSAPTVRENTVYASNLASDDDKRAITNTVKGNAGAVSVGGAYSYVDSQGHTITGTNTRQIINVAAGTEDSDAVNVAQLKAVANAVSSSATHYYSVNDNGTIGGNYNNDGAKADKALAAGVDALATGVRSVAIGHNTKAQAGDAVTIGTGTQTDALSTSAVVIGNGASATSLTADNTAKDSVAIGYLAQTKAASNIALGSNAKADTHSQATAIGYNSTARAYQSVAIGPAASTTVGSAVALGNNAQANHAHATALGSYSVTGAAVATTEATLGSITYGNFAGTDPTATISVGGGNLPVVGGGTKVVTRTITNVAAGRITPTSTDAINGSQLYATQKVIGNVAESAVGILGGNAALNPTTKDGTITMTNIGETGKDNVHDAIKHLNQGWQVTDNSGVTQGTVTAGEKVQFTNGTGTTSQVEAEAGSVTKVSFNVDKTTLSAGTDGKVNAADAGDKFATAQSVADAINAAGFTLTTAATPEGVLGAPAGNELIKSGNTITVEADKNIKVTQANGKVSIATKDDVNFTKVTIGNTAGDNTVLTSTVNGLDVGGDKITNVAAGNVAAGSTDAVNGGQLYDVKTTAESKLGAFTVGADNAATAAGITVNKDNARFDVVGATDGKVETAVDGRTIKVGLTADAKTSLGKADTALQNIQVAAGETNLTAVKSGDTVTLDFSETPTFTSVTSGTVTAGTGANQVVLDNAGVKVGGATYINGDGLNANSKVIANVAAGKTGTDAVNVSQLSPLATALGTTVDAAGNVAAPTFTVKKADGTTYAGVNTVQGALDNIGTEIQKPITFAGNSGTPTTKKLGETLTVKGTLDPATAASSTNIRTEVTNGELEIKLADAPTFAGKVTAQGGLDVNNQKITNVADGTNNNDAVNFSQLKAVQDAVKVAQSGAWELQGNGAKVSTIGAGAKVNFANGTGTTANVAEMGGVPTVTYSVNTTTLTPDATNAGKVSVPTQDNTFATAKSVAEAINAAGFTLATTATTAGEVAGVSGELINTGETVTIEADKNIKVTQTNGKVSIATKDAVEFTQVKLGDATNNTTLTSTADGLNVGGDKITNVAEGTVSASSKDAVNGSQLHAVKTTADSKLGQFTVGADNAATASGIVINKDNTRFDVVGQDKVTTAVSGNKITVDLTQAAKDSLVKADTALQNVRVAAGETNLTASKSGDTVTLDFSDTPTFNSVTSGTVTAGMGTNQVVLGNDGVKVGGNTYITNDGLNANNKVIKNVADGVQNSDAVNLGQLNNKATELVNTGIKVNADNNQVKTHKLGNELAIVAGNAAEPTSVANLKTEVTQDAASGKTTVTVKMKESPNFTAVTAGGTKIASDGLSFVDTTGTAVANSPKVSKTGIDAGGQKITNVADGVAAKDAVNVSQLEALKTQVASGAWEIQGNGTKSGDVKVGNKVNFANGTGTTAMVTTDTATGTSKVTYSVDKTTLSTAPDGKVSAVDIGDKFATAKSVADAINAAGFTLTTAAATGGETTTAGVSSVINAGETVAIEAGKNVKVSQIDGKVTVATKDAVEFTQVKLGNATNNTTLTSTANGLDVGNDKITNVAAGNIAAGSTDAVNGGQLHNVKTTAESKLGAFTVGADKNATATGITVNKDNTRFDVVGTTDGKVETAVDGRTIKVGLTADAKTSLGKADTALQSIKVKANGTDVKDLTQTDNVLNITQGNNITVAKDGTGDVKVSLNDNINVTGVKATTVTAGTGANQVVLGNDGVKVGGNTYITNDGLNANNKVIKNVADGVQNSDAVNLGQLNNKATELVNTGIKVNADNNQVKTHKLGNELAIVAGNTTDATSTANLRTDVAQDATGKTTVTVKMKESPNFTAVTAGGTKIASDGLSFVDNAGAAIPNSPKVSKTGIDAGGQKITNVQAGSDNLDAVNFAQLKAVQDAVKVAQGSAWELQGNGAKVSTVGAGAKVNFANGNGTTASVTETGGVSTVTYSVKTSVLATDPSNTGKVVVPTVTDTFATAKSVADAINAAGFTLKTSATANGQLGTTTGNELINAGDAITIEADKNIKVTQANGKVTVATKDDVNFTKVTIGDTTNNTVLTSTANGLDVGGDRIANMAAGKAATDAVNVSQLSPLATALGTKVNTDGTVAAPTFTVKKTDGTSNTPVATVQGALDQIGTEIQKPITFTGNSGKTDRTLGQELVVSGGLTSGTSSNTNVKTVVTAGKVDIQLADAPTFAGQVKANGFDANSQKITNVANGVNAGDAVNKSQLDNIGWNIKANNGTVVDVVKNADTVNFVNGTGTTAAVTTDPATNTTSVKYSVNKSTLTSTGGKATADTAGDAFATATDVANAINAAGFTLTTAATANGQVSGSSNELINAGDKVTVEADKNIKVTQAAGKVTVATKDEVNFTKVTIGNTTGNNTVLTSTADGLDVGGDRISNVAAGTKDTDAVNLKQLKDVQTSAGVKTVVSEGDGVKVTNKGTAAAPNYEVALNQATKDSLAKADSAVQTIKVQANGAAVKDLTQGDNVLNITQGDNVTVAKDGSNVKVSLNKNIAVDSVTAGTGANQVVLNNSGVNVGGKTYITGAGVNANNQKVTNVANGTVAANSKDAVNGGQLFAQGSGVQNIIGGTTTYNPTTGTYTNNNIGGTGKGTIHDAIEAVNTVAGKGWNLTAQGANSSNVAAGETVDLRNSDGNIVVSKPAATDAVTFNLAKNLNVDSVKTGNTTVNNGGVTIANTDPTKTVSLTSGGLNNGGNRVTNIADGVDAKDAVNVSQLNAVKTQAGVKTKVSAGDGVTVTNKGSATAPDYEVALNKATKDSLAKADSAVQTIKVQANGAAVKDLTQADNVLNITQGDNVTVSKDGGNVKVSLNKDINVNSVKAGDSTLTTNGLSINGGPSVTKAGIDAADKKLTNVAAGTVSNTSKDAINGSQLFAQGEGVKNIIGGSTTYDPTSGTYTNNNIGGTGASNINDAIQTVRNAASAGWNLSAQGANKTNVAPNATVDLNNTDGNIVISKTTANNDVTFNLAKDLNVDTVKANTFTAGNTTINNGGLTIANTDPAKVVSLSGSGLNNGGNKVVNVAAGTADTDAANVGQLKGATTALGGGAGINADGTFKAPTYTTTTTNGTTLTANNVGDALTNLNNEVVKPLSFAADVGTNVERKLGSTVSVNGDSKNITTSTTANGVKVELNNTINVSGVVADGVSIKGNGPTLTKNGMNMAGQAITNMANGLPTKIDANGNVVPMTTVDIKQAIIDGTLDASVLNNAVNVGDLVEQGNNVLNVSKNIYGKDKDENPYVRADGTISSAGRAALRTYNVDDNGTLEHNGIFDAIKNMNEQGIKFFHTNDGVVKSTKDGYSEEDSNANAAYSTAIGYKALVSKNAVAGLAVGPASLADGAYSVALGAESVARDAHVAAGTTDSAYTYGGLNDNNVAAKATKATRVASIGAEGKERQLQHVAAGVISPTSTDAVNGSQLYYTNKAVENNTRAINQLRGDVHKMDRNLRAGVAGAYAAASLGQVYLPGKTQVSLGTGYYRGESAVALGVSRVSDNGKVQVRLLGSTNSRGDTGAGASVSYLW